MNMIRRLIVTDLCFAPRGRQRGDLAVNSALEHPLILRIALGVVV